jgi:nitronate monooxygenase
MKTGLSARLGLQGPLILAPMAGGPSTPALAAAVSNAGALGFLGGAYLQSQDLERELRETRGLTGRAFGVNLFVPGRHPEISQQRLRGALDATRGYRGELGLPEPELKPPFMPDFGRQLEVILREKPAAFSFVFGLLERAHLDELRGRSILSVGTATSLEEGLALEELGVDAVVAQGVEAGGHRGIFSADQEDPLIGALALTRALAGKLRIPVIAAGGIMNGRGIADALGAGAEAAQLGTAFLLCDEAGTSKPYREALRERGSRTTRLTRVFSGRLARGLENRFMREMAARGDAILPFPAQNELTRDLRRTSASAGNPEFLSLWAGEGVGLIRDRMKAGELVRVLFEELHQLTSA